MSSIKFTNGVQIESHSTEIHGIDRDNVLVNTSYSSSGWTDHWYTATQDCYVCWYGNNHLIKIDTGIIGQEVSGYAFNAAALPIPVKKGQKISGYSNANMALCVYGVK